MRSFQILILILCLSCQSNTKNEQFSKRESEEEKNSKKDSADFEEYFQESLKKAKRYRSKYSDEEWMAKQNTAVTFGSKYDAIDIYHVSKSWIRSEKLTPYEFRSTSQGPSESIFYINWSQEIVYTDNIVKDPPSAKFQRAYQFISPIRDIELTGSIVGIGCFAQPLESLKSEMYKIEPTCKIMILNDPNEPDCISYIDIFFIDQTERFCVRAIERDINGIGY